MSNYITPKPTVGCAFPKPVRNAARSVTKKANKKSPETEVDLLDLTAHDKILYGCVRYLQENYPDYKFLHIPNELYGLISGMPSSNGLFFVFEKALGKTAAARLKQVLADAFVGVCDLTVYSSTGKYLMGEIKVGKDVVHKRQRQKCPTNIFVWSSVESFVTDMALFDRQCQDVQSKGCSNDIGTTCDRF